MFLNVNDLNKMLMLLWLYQKYNLKYYGKLLIMQLKNTDFNQIKV